MSSSTRLQYYRRIFEAYLGSGKSQLTFWHEIPEENAAASSTALGEYYMTFAQKADYAGHHDASGIPMLDYRGAIGLQYNPISVAQWGLGNFNLFTRTRDDSRRRKFLQAADWLADQLEQNPQGVWVWNHRFDWEYRELLKSPWYSGLAQGQGISLLLRAHVHSGDDAYRQAAQRAYSAFQRSVKDGGVLFFDEQGDVWLEEYIVSPPTHILNGFIWATWGIFDYALAFDDAGARQLFSRSVDTLLHNLERYDTGFWSLYEQSGTRLQMLASAFYHRLHIVQLRVMYRLTGNAQFAHFADRWDRYTASAANRARALCYKSAFKLCYY